MIFVHTLAEAQQAGASRFSQHMLAAEEPIPPHTRWIDLLEPTREEDRKVEEHLGISIPTREDMGDIEPSELLYTADGARYLTVRLVSRVKTEPEIEGVSIILKDGVMITVRYVDPMSFQMFNNRIARPGACEPTMEGLVSALLDAIIDRAADVLQMTGSELDKTSRRVFEGGGDARRRSEEYTGVLKALGRHGDLISKIRESLVSVERVLLYMSATYRNAGVSKDLREEVKSTLRDLQSLEEHATFQSQKIQFLLDATLGLVNLEQNNIIKLFSVMAVIFMPPTLIASIYGMNFEVIPELKWSFGYPMALIAMVLAAILPYLFFRWKKWL
jgi:magnesium transporter